METKEKTITEVLRAILKEELNSIAASNAPQLVSLKKFLADSSMSRTTVWRAEKEGKIKLSRVGRRILVDLNQFKKAA